MSDHSGAPGYPDAVRLRLAELRRIRASARGKMIRAQDTINLLHAKIRKERDIYERAGNEIRAHGARVKP